MYNGLDGFFPPVFEQLTREGLVYHVELMALPNNCTCYRGCVYTEFAGNDTFMLDWQYHTNKHKLVRQLRSSIGGPLDLLL